MEIYGYSLNSTSAKNNTNFDHLCTKRPVGTLIWAIFSVPSACVGIPASGWLLWLLVQMPRIGSSNSLYMLNLTFIDLFYNLFIGPYAVNFFVWHDTVFVTVFLIFLYFCICGRPLFMAFTCVDCYIAVVYPISYMTIKNGRYRIVLCVLGWLLTLAFFLWAIFSQEVLYMFIILSILLFLSALVITFCNISTFCALRKPDSSGRGEIHPQKRRAKQSIINSLVMTLLSYPPLVIVITVYILMNMSLYEFVCDVWVPSLIFSTVGSTVMPLLYLGNLGKLKGIRLAGWARAE